MRFNSAIAFNALELKSILCLSVAGLFSCFLSSLNCFRFCLLRAIWVPSPWGGVGGGVLAVVLRYSAQLLGVHCARTDNHSLCALSVVSCFCSCRSTFDFVFISRPHHHWHCGNGRVVVAFAHHICTVPRHNPAIFSSLSITARYHFFLSFTV